jgi:site-specific recombinase XerD
MHFRVAADDFLEFCCIERRLSHHTLGAYASDLADFGRWLPGGILVAEISEADLKEYLAALVGQRNLAVPTVRRRFACLRAFFRRTAALGHVTDPFTSWRPQLPRRKRLPRTLSRTEISTLLTVGQTLQSRTSDTNLVSAVRLMVSTGIRVGELCKLRIEDISPDAGSLRINGKGSRDRIVYISDAGLRRELQQLAQGEIASSAPRNALFVNRLGLPMQPQTIRSRLRKHASGIGLVRRVTPHMLRHTAATLLIETGVDIRFVQRLLGHSSIATTEIYTHVSDEALRVTLERADILQMFPPRLASRSWLTEKSLSCR